MTERPAFRESDGGVSFLGGNFLRRFSIVTRVAVRGALALLLLVIAPCGIARADGIDDFNNSWAGQALISQRLLDLDAPLAENNIVGSHNSFNSAAYTTATSYLDPNQIDSIFNQLRMGARAVEFDVHWTAKTEGPFDFPDRLLLCHGTAGHVGCSFDDRYFAEGLDEISAWLGTASSIDQVLILHIEDHMDGQHGEAFNQVNARFGNKVYASGGCSNIPSNVSKADVLAAGKNVVIWNEGGCSGDANWNGMVFTGLGGLSRVWEDSTVIGGIGGAGASISDVDLINYFATGTNIVDLDQLHQNDNRLPAAVWTWEVNEPNNFGGIEHCAIQNGNGRWNDDDCSLQSVFACENTNTGSWAVSAMSDSWGVGSFACASLGAEYQFSVPTNSQDNQALKLAKENAGQSFVWMNHDDRDVEGMWGTSSTADAFYDAGALTLLAGQSVRGINRLLKMEGDCNLVVYSVEDVGGVQIVGGDLWNSGTANAGSGCYTEFQSDGNLVVYDGGGAPLWFSSTSGSELRLQEDGNVVIYSGGGGALWQTFTNYPSDYVLTAGQIIASAGQILHSENRKLEMRGDCNLVVYSFVNGVTGGVLWQSNTAGAGGGCYAELQGDGNFVLKDSGGQALWSSGTSGTSGAELRLQSDGNLAVYNGAGEPLWNANSNPPIESTFFAGQFLLSAGQFVYTENRRLEMRADCNVALHSYDNAAMGALLWHTDTANAGTGCYVDFQADGNFVVYNGAGQPLWASGTSGTSGGELRLQEDGNLVIYNGVGQPLWNANSNIPDESIQSAGLLSLSAGQFIQIGYRRLEMQSDCNLVVSSVVNGLVVDSLWHSDTINAGTGCRVDFQADGNLVVLDEFNQALWASGTSGTVGAELRLQDDGNMVIYNGAGQPLWGASTQGIFVGGSVCGDLTCEGAETCGTCAIDCGTCGGPVCGDLTCNGTETCSTCQGDCEVCAGVPVPALPWSGVVLLVLALPASGVVLQRLHAARQARS
ncbi:MAG: hypothetical protein ACI9QQ_000582 [Myxococcota bacterium]|jgi:hypothetical protein